MPFRRAAVVTLLIVIGGLVGILVVPWNHFSWTTVPIFLVFTALAVGLLFLRNIKRLDFRSQNIPIPTSAPRPISQSEHRLSRVRVPSSTADYDFLFSATVRWGTIELNQITTLANQAGAAREAIIQRARLVTEKSPPARAALVEQELSGWLGNLERDRSGQLMVMAEDIVLTLTDHDQKRLDKLADMRKDEEVWKHEWRWDQLKRRYLADDVLKDTGSTVVWWLARNDHQVERTIGDLHQLARLSAAANNRDLPEWFHRLDRFPAQATASLADGNGHSDGHHRNGIDGAASQRIPDTAADHLNRLLDSAGLTHDDPQRRLLADQIAETFHDYQMEEFAQTLRPPPASTAPSGPTQDQEPAAREPGGHHHANSSPDVVVGITTESESDPDPFTDDGVGADPDDEPEHRSANGYQAGL